MVILEITLWIIIYEPNKQFFFLKNAHEYLIRIIIVISVLCNFYIVFLN
jgi:hypothetical protein